MATVLRSKILDTTSYLSKLSRVFKSVRFCATSTSEGKPDFGISLRQPLPDLPPYVYIQPSKQPSAETRVTTLSNGLRVASENLCGDTSTVGVVIDSGSRYEGAYPSGISHFIEKLRFPSTKNYDKADDIIQVLEQQGGIFDTQGSRDTLIYAVSAKTSGLEVVCDVLSDVILQPLISDDELEEVRVAIGYDLESMAMRPEPDIELMEMIHAAAYRDNTLGLAKICPSANINIIDRATLYSYMDAYHQPSRMVLAGVGMEHDALVRAAENTFLKKTPIWLQGPDNKKFRDDSLAQYTGGKCLEERDLSNVSLGPNEMPELAHVLIGMESCSHGDDDFVASCVVNTLLGGGGSFSAGGPGKGMYTRLYLNVLNRYHWMHNATAYNHPYSDTGLFCIHGSSNPKQVKFLVEIIAQEIVNLTGKINKEELDRAKRLLQSSLMTNLENRPVIFEDIGRQVLTTGHRQQPKYYYDKIATITEDDIHRIAARMINSKVSVAALGSLTNLPDYDEIQTLITSLASRRPKKFSVFN